jgi:tetratricopeptide (TPR) repeat protein
MTRGRRLATIACGAVALAAFGWWSGAGSASRSASIELGDVRILGARPTVRAGELVALRAELAPDGVAGVELRWLGEAGTFTTGAHGTVVAWRAPLLPGRHEVEVTAVLGDQVRRASVRFETYLPAPGRDVALAREIAEEVRDTAPAQLETEIQALVPIATRAEVATTEEAYARLRALDELGDVYLKAGRYEDAAATFARMETMLVPRSRDFKRASERLGIAAYYLGDDAAAIHAIQAGAEYANGISRYYLARLLEERGDYRGAIENYAWAARRHDNLDAVMRQALLELTRLGDAARAAQTLATASTYHHRDDLLARLAEDPDLRLLREAWLASAQVMKDEPGWVVPAPSRPRS